MVQKIRKNVLKVYHVIVIKTIKKTSSKVSFCDKVKTDFNINKMETRTIVKKGEPYLKIKRSIESHDISVT